MALSDEQAKAEAYRAQQAAGAAWRRRMARSFRGSAQLATALFNNTKALLRTDGTPPAELVDQPDPGAPLC